MFSRQTKRSSTTEHLKILDVIELLVASLSGAYLVVLTVFRLGRIHVAFELLFFSAIGNMSSFFLH